MPKFTVKKQKEVFFCVRDPSSPKGFYIATCLVRRCVDVQNSQKDYTNSRSTAKAIVAGFHMGFFYQRPLHYER